MIYSIAQSFPPDKGVAIADLHFDHPPVGLFDPMAQYIVAVGICLCFIMAGAGMVIWALRDRIK